MPTLFLVRHAEPMQTGVILGQLDPPLSERGRAEAVNIWRDRAPLAVVYSSPLLRAIETAELIGAAPVEILDDLREIGYGAWDGKTWAEIEAADAVLAHRKQADWTGVTPPGGENWETFRARVAQAGKRILEGPFPCAVVAHAAVNAVLVSILTGADPLQFQQDYGEVLAIDL
ncbi:MAG: histidine phosphatase family protein [Bryobacteraceae bacterium]